MGSRGGWRGGAWVALCVGALALGVGCQKDLGAGQPTPLGVERPAQTQAPAQPAVPSYPEETYGDPEFAKSPRIQFLWNPVSPMSKDPAAKDPDTIWSMKLDGSDIRRAISPEVLFGGDLKYVYEAARSPDGRFIACSGDDREGDAVRCVIDLKERTLRVISKMTGPPYLNWTPDSRQVVFYGNSDLWQYDVVRNQLTKLPLIYSAGFRVIDGGKRLVTLNDRKIEYYDRSGRLLRRLEQPFDAGHNHQISLDGRTFLVTVGGDSVIFRADQPGKVLWRDSKFRPRAVFGPGGMVLYYMDGERLTTLDLSSRQEKVLATIPGRVPSALTLLVGSPQ